VHNNVKRDFHKKKRKTFDGGKKNSKVK